MLTRLKVNGFKNLMDVDVRFGPFTCIAGANGVGKSNLFDAIRFLSLLADNTLIDAALKMRGTNGRTRDIRSLFHPSTDEMSFEAEMIIPRYGKDRLAFPIQATSTALRYSLTLRYQGKGIRASNLDVIKEELASLREGETNQSLLFRSSNKVWSDNVIVRKSNDAFFMVDWNEGSQVLYRPQEDELQPFALKPKTIPRTLLSTAEGPMDDQTPILTRQEMQAWHVFHLEPSALTALDQVKYDAQIQPNGADLAATIYRIAKTSSDPERIYAMLRNKLAMLVSDVRELSIDYNEARDEVGLRFKDATGTEFPARALSDGTLRFLALAAMELDPQLQGVICLEEPENGLHPTGIEALIELLQDIAVSPDFAVDADNPLRQVMIATQSPSVVQQVPVGSLLLAQPAQKIQRGQWFNQVIFKHIPNTWRDKAPEGTHMMMPGELLKYLNPVRQRVDDNRHERVLDREDLQLLLPWSEQ
jgi:predicted ATPase